MISVCSRTSGVSVFKSIVLEKIPAFLLAQKSTIRNHLSLAIDNITFDVSPILHDQWLQLISCLHDISLTLPYANEATTLTPTELSSKEWLNILGTHQQHLRSLDLSFTPDCTVNPYAVLSTLRREWCSVKLPNLRNLAIRIGSANLYSACLSGGGRVVTEVEALKRDVWLWRGLVPCDRSPALSEGQGGFCRTQITMISAKSLASLSWESRSSIVS